MAKRVLICDDEADVRCVLRMLLERDYEVVEAESGRQALRLIEAQKPALVLLDVAMPGMTGVQTLRAYHQAHPDLRTIILTSKKDVALARRALDLGATVYVTKPFDPNYLQAEVARLLEPAAGRKPEARPWRLVDQDEAPRPDRLGNPGRV